MAISNKRCIQILNLLLKYERMTGDQLAVSIGVSSRTIRNDMKDLNAVLENQGACVVSEIGGWKKISSFRLKNNWDIFVPTRNIWSLYISTKVSGSAQR